MLNHFNHIPPRDITILYLQYINRVFSLTARYLVFFFFFTNILSHKFRDTTADSWFGSFFCLFLALFRLFVYVICTIYQESTNCS